MHKGVLAEACNSECQGALALYDRIKSPIIRPLCVFLHSLRHDLIPVLGLGSVVQSQYMLLPALPRWAPKSNREPFGVIELWLIGEKELTGCLISTIFMSHPTHHINLSCCFHFHLQFGASDSTRIFSVCYSPVLLLCISLQHWMTVLRKRLAWLPKSLNPSYLLIKRPCFNHLGPVFVSNKLRKHRV